MITYISAWPVSILCISSVQVRGYSICENDFINPDLYVFIADSMPYMILTCHWIINELWCHEFNKAFFIKIPTCRLLWKDSRSWWQVMEQLHRDWRDQWSWQGGAQADGAACGVLLFVLNNLLQNFCSNVLDLPWWYQVECLGEIRSNVVAWS